MIKIEKRQNPKKPKKKPVKKIDGNEANKPKKEKGFRYLGGLLLSKMAHGGAILLRRNADEVNKLNVFPVPDGDTGDNMRMTIESGIAAIENLDTDDIAEVMKVFSHGMLLGARGNSGVILSQFFAGTAKGFEGVNKADPDALGKALESGVKQAYTSVMTPTEGTILTVAREAVEYAVRSITPQSTIRTFFADLVKEMHDSLDRTPETLAILKEAGVVDSGGAGLLYIMDGFNRVLNGEEISSDEKTTSEKQKPIITNFSFGPDSDMTYGYCTELLLQLQRRKTDIENFDIDALKDFLSKIGDSIVAFKTDSIVKIHVHTFTPDKVISHCLGFGEFLTVKIENMSVQHTSTIEDKETDKKAVDEKNDEPIALKKYGIVAVCNGEGVENFFKELGVDEIVNGGQTHNPSTNDFLDAFDKVHAEHIFVFPNNSNILLAAQQASELYKKSTIHVIPSKNIGTGYAGISVIDLDNDSPDAIISEIENVMKRVTAGYISPSIRDAEINGVHINKGDTIGIIEKEIVVSESDKMTASYTLAKKLMSGDKFMLSVFCGKDCTDEEKKKLEEYLKENCPDAEVYFIDGGQDIYPFIFVAE